MARFEDKVALITGGASGIGAAIRERFVDEGGRAALVDIDAERLARIGEDERTATITADVTDGAAVEAAVSATLDRFGRLDTVFAVAGASRFGTITDIADDDWRWTIDLVLGGVFHTVKYAARAMRERGNGGTMVIVSSLNAHVPLLFGASSYAAGKAGSENLTKAAAIELAPYGIRVNAVLPGLVATPLTAPMLGAVGQDFLDRILQRRAAEPSEIAAPCLYLASDDASYVNGTSLVVDGGWEISDYLDLRPILQG